MENTQLTENDVELDIEEYELIDLDFDDEPSIDMREKTQSPIIYGWTDVYRFFGLDPNSDDLFEFDYDQIGDMTHAFMGVHDCAYYAAEKQDFFPSIYARDICKREGKTNLFAENLS